MLKTLYFILELKISIQHPKPIGMKKVLFVEHGKNIKNYAIKAAKKIGCEVFVVSNTDLTFNNNFERGNTFVSDTFDSHTLLIDTLHFIDAKKTTFDAVVTYRENCVIPTADIAEALGLRGVSSRGARRSSQNKAMMRHYLKHKGFENQPDFKVLNIYNVEAEGLFNIFKKPCVIKPLFGTASHGVLYCDASSNFLDVKKHLLNELTPSAREIFSKFDGTVLIEEYKEGSLISVDGIVRNSHLYPLGTLEFVMGEKPYFTQIASYMPARISSDVQSLLYEKTQNIVSTLGFDYCGVHAEYRVDGNKIWLVEIAARLAGATIHETYARVYGADLVHESLLNLITDEIPNFKENNETAYHHLVFPKINESSILKSVEIPSEEIANVVDLVQFEQVGSNLDTYPCNPTPVLGYLLIGSDTESLRKRGEEIDKKIKITVEPK